jgi:hypothetical protein
MKGSSLAAARPQKIKGDLTDSYYTSYYQEWLKITQVRNNIS